MPKFVTRREAEPDPDSPEQLFRTLRPTEAGVRHLWAHQADILRDYRSQAVGLRDVALELPTGAGKTLVGLLLAEYRRRTVKQRVAYLCPNVQLARQACSRATGYGITAHVLTGRQSEWDPVHYMAYSRAQAIAITTYNSLFNTNPKLNDAQTIVLDDAHSAEGPVSSLWSITASRQEGELYRAVLAAVSDHLPRAFGERMAQDEIDPYEQGLVEILGPHQLAPRADLIREALESHATGNSLYSRQMVRDHLETCVLYISWRELLIRPLVVPAQDHVPFWQADQRIYMSATLGEGGELERAFGVPTIARLPVPAGWEEHGTGRRFFIFPGASLGQPETDAFVTDAIATARRALVLTTSNAELEGVGALLPPGTAAVRSNDLDADVSEFRGQDRAALLLANRYDGIDLADETCRLIVMSGLPSATHLQERFLYERLGARRVLSERIRTRITQGSGRCTRNARDYAAIIVRGDQLVDFLSRAENVEPMQPELQAEIEVGLRNSEESGADFHAQLDSFLNQDSDWAEADDYIRILTSERQRQPAPSTVELARSAPFEVQAWQAAWRGDLDEAVARARQAADALEGGSALRPYRCFWLYLAASWALSDASTAAGQTRAAAMASDAEACARQITWRPRLTDHGTSPVPRAEADGRSARAADLLADLGLRGLRFEARAAEVLSQLQDRASGPFERGLLSLGELLGFESVRPKGQAPPDSVWRDGDTAWFLFEAKTEAVATAPIPPSDVRQALTHHSWVESELGWPLPKYSMTVMVTDRATVEQSAAAIAASLFVASGQELVELGRAVVDVYRSVRAVAPGLSSEETASRFAAEFRDRGLDTDTLATRLASRAIKTLRQPGGPAPNGPPPA